jgi:uncharacterized RDD family membrane protein YckC
MADDVAAASDDLRALLRAYDGLLRWERELPRVLWMRHGREGLGRHLRVPRVRWGLRWLLVDHMQRTLNRVRAELDARQMLGPDPVDAADCAAVEACLRSLASIPRKRLSLFAAIAGVGLAHFLAQRNAAAEPLGHLTRNVAALSPDKIVSSLGEFNTPDKVAHAVLYLCIAFYAVLFVSMTTFRLKRILFNLGAERRATLRRVAACEHVTLSTGVYDLERRIAKRLKARHSFDEIPLDLIVSAMLVVPTLWAIAAVFVITHEGGFGLTWADGYFAAVAAQLLLLPLGRMAWIARVAAMRRRGVRPRPPAANEIPSRRRRLAAGTIDAIAVLVLALLIGAALALAVPSVQLVAVLLAPTLGAAVYTGIALLAGGTFGRRWTGLCVLDRDGTKARPAQIFARDVLLKWGVFNTLGFSLLWLHLPFIYLWPLWDPQRRTLYDLLADTVVVRAQPAPAAELVPLASGP